MEGGQEAWNQPSIESSTAQSVERACDKGAPISLNTWAVEDEYSEDVESEMVALATAEACAVAAAVRKKSSQADNSCNGEEMAINDPGEGGEESPDDTGSTASSSTKGIWNFTVGLVGKPSAGKVYILHCT